jgi:uncharacterized protein YdeI (YjbR/CyaY-like superfamily)
VVITMKALDRLTVTNAAAWARWLSDNGATSKGVSLTLAKKGILEPTSLSRNEAVEEALCHGWIDGQAHTIDDETWMQRYTPRAAKSIWSKRNICLVERLETEGRMQDAGRAAVESAKQDGRWQRAYSGTVDLEEMRDLIAAIGVSPVALSRWNDLSQGAKSQVYFRLSALKTEAGRAKHIRDYVEKLGASEPGSSVTPVPQYVVKSRKRTLAEEKGDVAIQCDTPAKKTRSWRHARPPPP